jgi:hypothetical protein
MRLGAAKIFELSKFREQARRKAMTEQDHAFEQSEKASKAVNAATKHAAGSPRYVKACSTAVNHLVEASLSVGRYEAERMAAGHGALDPEDELMEDLYTTEVHVAEFCTGAPRSNRKK